MTLPLQESTKIDPKMKSQKPPRQSIELTPRTKAFKPQNETKPTPQGSPMPSQ
jgi:hypothetical protein